MLKASVELVTVEGFAPSRPIQLNAPLPKHGSGQRPSRGHRPHGKPAARQGHAGQKQSRNTARPAGAGAQRRGGN